MIRKAIAFVLLGLFSISVQAESIGEYEVLIHSLKPVSTSYIKNADGRLIDKSDEINRRIVELNQSIENDPYNPVLYLLRGLYFRALASIRNNIHLRKLRAEGIITREEANNDPERNKLIGEATKDYIKALDIDAQATHPMRLTRQMLYDMTQDVILDPSVNEAAIRREMALTPEPPTRTYYWDSYNVVFQSYLAARRYDEAIRVLDEMSGKFPKHTHEIQTAIANVQQAQDTPVEKWDETPVATVPKPQADEKDIQQTTQAIEPTLLQQPVVKAEDTSQKPEVKPEANNTLVIIIGIVLVILLLVGFMVARKNNSLE